MPKTNYLPGDKYGRLTIKKIVRELVGTQGRFIKKVICDCDCGNVAKTIITRLRSGGTKSCGCLSRENATKHKMSCTKIYRIWIDFRSRCNNPNNKRYKNYGGRGIGYSKEWDKFENFYKDMGLRTKGKSLDRIDNNSNYCKENCRWATHKEQSNNMRSNHLITFKNETHTISEWSDKLNIPYGTLATRIRRKWDIKKALKWR